MIINPGLPSRTVKLVTCMGYIGMCGPKGYGFSVALVLNRVSILAEFGNLGHE